MRKGVLMTKKQKALQVINLSLTIVLLLFSFKFISGIINTFTKLFDNALIAQLVAFCLFIIFVFLTIFIQSLIHESGHLVCGLLSGYKFSSFRILSLTFIKVDDKIQVKKFSIPGTAGQCLMLPPQPKDDKKIPYKLYNLGGCIFNLLSAIIFFLLAKTFQSSPAYPFLGLLGMLGIILFINNGLPMRTALIQNDAQNLIDISKSDEALNALAVQLLIAEKQTKGLKLCEMPNEWFEFPINELENPLISTVAYFNCVRLIEQGDYFNAHILVRKLLNSRSLLGVYHLLLELELLYLDAVNLWDSPDTISKKLQYKQKALTPLKNNITYQRVLYTIELVCRNNPKQAQKHLAQFEKLAKKHPYKQEIETERKLIDLAKSTAERTKSAQNPN